MHQGYYHCEASNQLGRAKSEVIKISPDPPIIDDYQNVPKFGLQPKIEISLIGKDHQFLCNATGIPRPRIGKKLAQKNIKLFLFLITLFLEMLLLLSKTNIA